MDVRTERLDLPAQPDSVGQTRRFVRSVLGDWELEPLVETVALLTSELATNAVLHARTGYAVVLTHGRDVLHVDVLDDSAVEPRRRQNSPTAATGRGVAIVARVAQSWGPTPEHERRGFAKGVRFTVPVTGAVDAGWGEDWPENA